MTHSARLSTIRSFYVIKELVINTLSTVTSFELDIESLSEPGDVLASSSSSLSSLRETGSGQSVYLQLQNRSFRPLTSVTRFGRQVALFLAAHLDTRHSSRFSPSRPLRAGWRRLPSGLRVTLPLTVQFSKIARSHCSYIVQKTQSSPQTP